MPAGDPLSLSRDEIPESETDHDQAADGAEWQIPEPEHGDHDERDAARERSREVVGERAQQRDAVADEHHCHARRVRVDAESLEQPRPRAKFPAGRDIPGTRELPHAVEDHVARDDHNQDADDDRPRHCPASLLLASLLGSQLSVQHYCRQPGPTGLSNMMRRLWLVS